MELSKDQKLLVEYLKNLEMSENLITSTMLAVKEKEKTNKLIDYILEATDKGEKLDKDKIVIRALEISDETDTMRQVI